MAAAGFAAETHQRKPVNHGPWHGLDSGVLELGVLALSLCCSLVKALANAAAHGCEVILTDSATAVLWLLQRCR